MKKARYKDLKGKTFCRITVICYVHVNNAAHWLCECHCGTKKVIKGSSLSKGVTKSCGCLSGEMTAKRFTKHGQARKTQEYRVWGNIKTRCFNKKAKCYKNYGGRGITVCERWLKSFEDFFSDMGQKPSSKHSIERIDNDGDYCKSNCRWATKSEQVANTRRNLIVEKNGKKMCLKDYAKFAGITYNAAQYRFKKGILN